VVCSVPWLSDVVGGSGVVVVCGDVGVVCMCVAVGVAVGGWYCWGGASVVAGTAAAYGRAIRP
jgi:hypothetical protein